MLFESLNKGIKEEVHDPLNNLQQGSLFHSIEYEITGILNKIKNIDTLNDKEIRDIILRQHNMILNYDLFLMSEETRSAALFLFTNKTFLESFIQVIRFLDLDRHEIICLNKIAYDYYILDNKDQIIADLLYRLTTEVNGREVTVLSGVLGIHGAQILSMIRNSSFKEEKCIHRVNTYLIKCAQDLTVTQIVSIYCYLFERFTNVFIYTMFETKPSGLSDIQYRKFDRISIAILDMLNSLPSSDIKRVLLDYAFVLNMMKGRTIEVRFAIKSATSYKRIIDCIKEIEFEDDNIKIP